MINICTIGWWTAQAGIIKALSALPWANITGIVCTTDNGGSSELLRKSLHIPSPGDVRNCITEVADQGHFLNKLLSYRFQEGAIKGMQLGNMIVGALARIEWSYHGAIEKIHEELGMQHHIYPVSNESTNICAVLDDGERVVGEWQIIKRVNQRPIIKYYLEHEAHALPKVQHALATADLIVICPGVLWTAIVSTLLHKGMKASIFSSEAPLVYMSNIMTYPSQTDDYRVSDHIEVIEKYTWRRPDYVIANDTPPNTWLLEAYASQNMYYVPLDRENIHEDIELITGKYILDVDASSQWQYSRHASTAQHVGPHMIQPDMGAVFNVFSNLVTKLWLTISDS